MAPRGWRKPYSARCDSRSLCNHRATNPIDRHLLLASSPISTRNTAPLSAAPSPTPASLSAMAFVAALSAPAHPGPARACVSSRVSSFVAARPFLHTARVYAPTLVVATASAPDAGGEDVVAPVPVPAGTSFAKLSLYIGLWYAFNIVYNISNKRVLNWFPMPWFVSWIQLAVGCLYVLPLWALRLRKAPKVSNAALKTLLPISIAHVVGHVSTVVSLGAVAVSFTHVVKSMEPFVNVVGSALFLKSVFPLPVYLSLLPVVSGVVMASVSEVSFTWLGFLSAMTSNFAFTARNLFSKVSMNEPKGENMGPSNLFAVLSIMSTVLLAPFALIKENPVKLKAAWLAATTGATAVVTAPKLLISIIISGLFFYLYQEVAFKALDSVHPITHAVANTVKRVVIIVTSVFVFQNPVTKGNALGSAVALLGVLVYSVTKNYFPELPKKTKTNKA